MEFVVAFTIGLLGSLHCIGMCGPIAFALPMPGQGIGGRLWAAILYNLGRAITYAILGIVFGVIGQAVWMIGLQQSFSVALGVFIIGLVIVPAVVSALKGTPAFYNRAIATLKGAMGRQFKKRGFVTLFTIGLLNGLLPCGFVYIGLAGAATTGHWYTGAAYMALFGLGTLPVMATLVLVKNKVGLKVRRSLGKVLPYAMVAIGALFILRGMNLGIPYVSPKAKPVAMQQVHNIPNTEQVIECH